MISMPCVDRNIPVIGSPKDGNASDKTINNELLTYISRHMARHHLEPGAFVYVADSAFDTGTQFVSRLPATYAECSRAIKEAVKSDQWHDIGAISESTGTTKRPPAHYQIYETTITINGRDYRAIVVHSSAHDKRRHKRIDRLLTEKRKELEAICKEASTSYFCQPDAQAAADKLAGAAIGSYHRVETQIKKVAKYARGRPPKDQSRQPRGYEYRPEIQIRQDPDAIAPLRLEAGCFVLITNMAEKSELGQWSAKRLLQLYKNQHGIEQNFGFLKDPVIVNSIFLKNPKRIEVLGLVLLIALLIWRLIERSMRKYIESTGQAIPGWENRPTKKTTAFMMTTKFASVSVVKIGDKRQLAYPLRSMHLEYLRALNVDPDIFTYP
ncbi:transposase [Desulfosalsimonas propionicica]|uniref:Transposase n=1 Tax=Desulfosalsimonas propionicica TaxID=332175 RepID=A0A7W0CBI7_9BACT|nr:transposase [Desulfosalsimonas propionicica]